MRFWQWVFQNFVHWFLHKFFTKSKNSNCPMIHAMSSFEWLCWFSKLLDNGDSRFWLWRQYPVLLLLPRFLLSFIFFFSNFCPLLLLIANWPQLSSFVLIISPTIFHHPITLFLFLFQFPFFFNSFSTNQNLSFFFLFFVLILIN